MELIQSVSTAIDIARKLRELSKKIADADLKMLVADLTEQLADAKLAAANLKTELAEARSEIADLKQRQSAITSEKPSVVGGGYKFENDTNLYCTGCFDSNGKKILLSKSGKDFADVFGKWNCPICKQYYG